MVMKLSAFGLSDVGKKRSRNEDSFLVNNQLGLYIVADGMGGHSGGEYASRLAVSTVEEVLQSMNGDPEATVISGVNSEDSEYGDRLKYAIEVAGQKIYDQALYDPDLKGMGTTITAVIVDSGVAYVANVGDSRVYLLRGEEIKQVTTDHSLVSEQVRSGLISATDAKKHRLKNIITRSVGYQEDVEIDLYLVPLKAQDRLLLCSDGLTNMVDDSSIKNIIENKDLENSCRNLIQFANERGGDDNITVVMCQASP
jgi:protein phosphatase